MAATRVPMCTVTARRAWPAQYVVIRPYPDIKSHTCYSCQYRVHNTRYHIAYRPFPFSGANYSVCCSVLSVRYVSDLLALGLAGACANGAIKQRCCIFIEWWGGKDSNPPNA